MRSLQTQFDILHRKVVHCRRCPRLVNWREEIAEKKTRRFAEWVYWGKPVPGFGDPHSQLLLIGLAPAAHGGNRTGRMFTGDESGDWLYGALYKAGFATQPRSADRNDGLRLDNCYITAACRCAPPGNKPLLEEIHNCRPFLLSELRMLKNLRVIIGLGKIGYDSAFDAFRQLGWTQVKSRPKFGHGVCVPLNNHVTLFGSYHPSQQNTFTGRLTRHMFNDIFRKAKEYLAVPPRQAGEKPLEDAVGRPRELPRETSDPQ